MNTLPHYVARDRRRALAWAIGITVAAGLVIGGVFAGSALAGGSSAGPAGLTGQAATLNAALSAAGSTPASSARHRTGALARLRRLGGMYGQVSYRTRTDATRTLAFERGVVSSTGSGLVVRAANGTSWTWQLTSDSVVRKGGAKSTRSALATGEHVIVAGPVASGARDARLVWIRTAGAAKAPRATPSPATPSPSGPASTSPASTSPASATAMTG
jgi:hypothetical protein